MNQFLVTFFNNLPENPRSSTIARSSRDVIFNLRGAC